MDGLIQIFEVYVWNVNSEIIRSDGWHLLLIFSNEWENMVHSIQGFINIAFVRSKLSLTF